MKTHLEERQVRLTESLEDVYDLEEQLVRAEFRAPSVRGDGISDRSLLA